MVNNIDKEGMEDPHSGDKVPNGAAPETDQYRSCFDIS